MLSKKEDINLELTFEWHEGKAKESLKKHKFSFEEAKTIFGDPFLMTYTSNWIKLRFLILSSHPSPLGSGRHMGCNQIAVSSSGEYILTWIILKVNNGTSILVLLQKTDCWLLFTQSEGKISELSVVARQLHVKGQSMKKENPKQSQEDKDDIRAEYDFKSMTGGVRGKYYKAYRAGHTVKIHKADGTTLVQHFKLEDGAVMLEPDIREYFPDSESVNTALRCLIPLLSPKHCVKVKRA